MKYKTKNVLFFFPEKQYEKSDFVVPTENNSQPINSLETTETHKEGNKYYNYFMNLM